MFLNLGLKVLPSMLVTVPPASSKMIFPAATSQGWRSYSQKPSKRPAATKHRSSAALPKRRTPWPAL